MSHSLRRKIITNCTNKSLAAIMRAIITTDSRVLGSNDFIRRGVAEIIVEVNNHTVKPFEEISGFNLLELTDKEELELPAPF